MSVLYRRPVIGMQIVSTLKGVIFVTVSRHSSMLTTQMNAYVRLDNIIKFCVCILSTMTAFFFITYWKLLQSTALLSKVSDACKK